MSPLKLLHLFYDLSTYLLHLYYPSFIASSLIELIASSLIENKKFVTSLTRMGGGIQTGNFNPTLWNKKRELEASWPREFLRPLGIHPGTVPDQTHPKIKL